MRMNDEVQISSLLVQHRDEALPALQAFVAQHAELELALNAERRAVILCETDDQRAMMDLIDAIRDLSGVITVSLIYHHAEPRADLEQIV